MKIGIDSYSFHRFFGEVYPHQKEPSEKISYIDFLEIAKQMNVDGVCLESCFFTDYSKEYLSQIKNILDTNNFDRVWAWGHPDGLEGGKNEKEFDEMLQSFEYAKHIGAKVMRVVGSSLMFRHEPHEPQLERLASMFKKAAVTAKQYDIKMAIENHIDFNSNEILWLIKEVNSPYLGVNLDTANFVRVLDDPVKATEKLAPYVYATHVKDVAVQTNVPADTWHFFASVPAGKGLVDIKSIAKILKKANYEGFLAVEIDSLHPDYDGDDINVVKQSLDMLREL